jgi:hypothetical protein
MCAVKAIIEPQELALRVSTRIETITNVARDARPEEVGVYER